MPIYCFQCECGSKPEIILSVEDRNLPQTCICGKVMRRVFTTPLITIASPTGRGKILSALNQENNINLPARGKDRQRIEQALSKGLDPPKQVVGRGF